MISTIRENQPFRTSTMPVGPSVSVREVNPARVAEQHGGPYLGGLDPAPRGQERAGDLLGYVAAQRLANELAFPQVVHHPV